MKNISLFTAETQALFYNLKALPIQQMLDFDFLCQRQPSLAAIIHPGKKGFHKAFFGQKEILIPLYSGLLEASLKHPAAEVLINFASFRSAYDSSRQALELPALRTIAIVAEGIPERQVKELIAIAQQKDKIILGPATVGGIAAGKFRIGYAGGKTENIIKAKLYRPGSVGLVSKSGGMMNELFTIIARATDGVYEGLAIGGDAHPGSTLLDHLLRYEANPEVKLLVALGELGGTQEYDIVQAKQAGKLIKPVVMFVSGACASIFPWEVQFGHAGAKAGKEMESAAAKNKALREAGIIVPDTFEELEGTLKIIFDTLVQEGKIAAVLDGNVPVVPLDYNEAVKQGLVRKATSFTSTISSDLGDELTYGGIAISSIIEQNYTLGQVLGLLWFKKKISVEFAQFLEMALIICADHGPAVSGAHNAIVAARAGKNVISSLCSGLLTIGPRFGGALDDACRYFKDAGDKGIPPRKFVEAMKQEGILIPGIGHRLKSRHNPDQRVELLKEFAVRHLPVRKYLEYALAVEQITLQKSENLILNVDGCLAMVFLDMVTAGSLFSAAEIDEIVELGYLNGLFALARSIGLVGHILDQKRLKAELYRHPTEDILYQLE